MARILITRPLDDAVPLAALLKDRGHDTIIAPLLEITYLNTPPDLTGVQALLFTSANGVRAAAPVTGERALPALCVGDATGREATRQGFTDVASADGGVTALAALVRQKCDPEGGPLVHVAGSAIAGALSETLERAGFTVRRAVLYDAHRTTTLPAPAADALRNREIDGVMLFSPRTAAAFATLVTDAGLAPCCTTLDMLCLSGAVADALGNLPRRRTQVARHPTQDALMALLRVE